MEKPWRSNTPWRIIPAGKSEHWRRRMEKCIRIYYLCVTGTIAADAAVIVGNHWFYCSDYLGFVIQPIGMLADLKLSYVT
jgi:hypothetical protein